MTRALLLALVLGPLAGCNLFGNSDEAEPNCDIRHPYYLDADADGVGDAGSAVYIGCAIPEGYTDVPPTQGGADTGDTGETADTGGADTGDTGETADTGGADTGDTGETADTGGADTGDTGETDSGTPAETDSGTPAETDSGTPG